MIQNVTQKEMRRNLLIGVSMGKQQQLWSKNSSKRRKENGWLLETNLLSAWRKDVVSASKNNVVEDVVVGKEIVGALILRPSNTDCEPMRGMKLINEESSWRLFQSLKKLGVVAYELKDDEDENIEMNRIALNTALLFQKHFLPSISLYTEAEEHLYRGPRMGRTGRTRKKNHRVHR
ncbi:UNVERIFIED_CONTAM: hypothetical protein Slati_2719100 [Sesamum latifolium]|uniref:Uncharacterized protein n=1 Tax=Sesamum latifolium TaxID=2727402 RepID=A0AAW2VXF5_9LAMI